MADTPIPPEAGITIHDVVGGNLAGLPALAELFLEGFPAYAPSLPRIRRKAERPPDANPRLLEHQWLIEVDGRAAGMMAFKYVCYRNVGIAAYLTVRPDYRARAVAGYPRLAGWLIAAAGRQLCLDAERLRRPRPWGLAGEVTTPGVLARYIQYGALALPVSYLEPYFPDGRRDNLPAGEAPRIEWHPAQLALMPVGGASLDVDDPALLEDVVIAFLVEHYGLPADHPQVQQIVADARACAHAGRRHGG